MELAANRRRGIRGALVLGFLLTLMTEQLTTAPWLRSALAIGFLGAYTTFSTFAQESRDLFAGGHASLAVVNTTASVVVGILAVAAGTAVGRTL